MIETFIDKCEDSALVANQLVPAMLDPILGDYARNVPDARDAEARALSRTITRTTPVPSPAPLPYHHPYHAQ